MTDPAKRMGVCKLCGEPFERKPKGRPAVYCCASHRQEAHVLRRIDRAVQDAQW